MMSDLYMEMRPISDVTLLPRDLVRHMYSLSLGGGITVVTKEPKKLLADTKKQWRRFMRQVQAQRRDTDDVLRMAELSRRVSWMQQMTFAVQEPDGLSEAGILFASVEDLVRMAQMCNAMYITYPIERVQLYMITSWMAKGGKVMRYT
jgi:hypothetical protein